VNGKIALLPRPIQEELNQRLQRREPFKIILAWVNSFPETKALLEADFDGVPVSKQNLTEYKRFGFLDWEARQKALEFAATLNEDDTALQKILPSDLAEKLCRWVSVRYAAATRTLSNTSPDLEKELRHLRNFCLLILALRRGELNAGRLALEQQRLNLVIRDTKEAKNKEFGEWTNQPDIQAKLHPDRDPDQVRRDVIPMLDRELLGSVSPDVDETDADPASMI